MNKHKAKLLAETINNSQLLWMFQKARVSITDWEVPSTVNKGISKGAAWNILASDFDVKKQYHVMAKINMLREFGNYLPENVKNPDDGKPKTVQPPLHQKPIFDTDLNYLRSYIDAYIASSANNLEWAEYATVDANNDLCFHKSKPIYSDGFWDSGDNIYYAGKWPSITANWGEMIVKLF